MARLFGDRARAVLWANTSRYDPLQWGGFSRHNQSTQGELRSHSPFLLTEPGEEFREEDNAFRDKRIVSL